MKLRIISIPAIQRQNSNVSIARKAQCTPKEPQRKILRSIYEPSIDMARNITKTIDYAIFCKLRKKVEMLFAHLKRILKLDRFRLRGLCGAKDEFHPLPGKRCWHR